MRLRQTTILVVGTFRSGTNAVSKMLEDNFNCRTTFNKYFWKHGLPPHNVPTVIPHDVPIVCMVRRPEEFNRSIFRFWHARRIEQSPSKDISIFIRSKFIVYDNTGGTSNIHYFFQNPTDYWNRFYYSWTHWEKMRRQICFVNLEELEADPQRVFLQIESRFSLQRRRNWNPRMPERRVGPDVGKPVLSSNQDLGEHDREFIRSHVLPDVWSEFYDSSTTHERHLG